MRTCRSCGSWSRTNISTFRASHLAVRRSRNRNLSCRVAVAGIEPAARRLTVALPYQHGTHRNSVKSHEARAESGHDHSSARPARDSYRRTLQSVRSDSNRRSRASDASAASYGKGTGLPHALRNLSVVSCQLSAGGVLGGGLCGSLGLDSGAGAVSAIYGQSTGNQLGMSTSTKKARCRRDTGLWRWSPDTAKRHPNGSWVRSARFL